jgi:hypothetical protein
MADQMTAHAIAHRVDAKAERVEAGHVASDDGSEHPFDLLVAVAPHRALEVATASGLTGPHGSTAARSQPGTPAVMRSAK